MQTLRFSISVKLVTLRNKPFLLKILIKFSSTGPKTLLGKTTKGPIWLWSTEKDSACRKSRLRFLRNCQPYSQSSKKLGKRLKRLTTNLSWSTFWWIPKLTQECSTLLKEKNSKEKLDLMSPIQLLAAWFSMSWLKTISTISIWLPRKWHREHALQLITLL